MKQIEKAIHQYQQAKKTVGSAIDTVYAKSNPT
jgi:hypothetical protein